MSKTLMEQAYERLRGQLEAGTRSPGTRLVNRTLGKELGVSTVTLREAIHRLSTEQSMTHRFAADGYVALPGFLSPDAMQQLHGELARFIREVVPAMPAEHVFYEDKSRPETLKQLQLMHTYDAYFAELFLHGRFRELAQTLLADDVKPFNVQYFNKPPLAGQPTPPHQDGYYFMLDPCEAVTMWLALEPVDEENGCVRYVRGSHCRGMRAHGQTGVLGFSQGILDYGTTSDLEAETAFPAQPGDLLVHHALTIHRADGNHSATRTRRSLGFIYFAQRAREDKAGSEDYQKRLTEELLAAGKI